MFTSIHLTSTERQSLRLKTTAKTQIANASNALIISQSSLIHTVYKRNFCSNISRITVRVAESVYELEKLFKVDIN